MPKANELIGQTFGNLTVIDLVPKPTGKKFKRYVVCLCSCGNVYDVRTDALVGGVTDNCGCLTKQKLREHIYRNMAAGKMGPDPKHGHTIGGKTPEYIAWYHMNERCRNSSHRDYHNYGGRGISICERWCGYDGFSNFFADMGERPSNKHTLDRKNNDGNYKPSNCRWVTRQQQNRNRRGNVLLTHDGKTQTIADWADELGMKYMTLYCRIQVHHWPLSRALQPLQSVGEPINCR